MTVPQALYDRLTTKQRRILRNEYVKCQGGRCYACGEMLHERPAEPWIQRPVSAYMFPRGFFRNPVHLHHDHGSGMTKGAVHAHCNAVLFQYYKQ